MADIKKPSAPAPSPVEPWSLFILIAVLLFISSFISKVPALDKAISDIEEGNFSLGEVVPTGEIALKSKAVTNNLTSVRQDVAGSIIGEQIKGTVGEVVDGPIISFGKTWWRVNFEEPPSGWVEESAISSHVGIIKSINFIPSVYGGYLRFWLFPTIVMLVFIIILRFKFVRLNKFIEKKKRVERGEDVAISENDAVGGSVNPVIKPLAVEERKEELQQNNKWQHIQTLMNSHNMNDWRQAIIEADIILDEMLTKMQYAGDSIGDKLKNVEESDFITLNKAWEAHKIRNQIAHKGSDFTLTKQEASRAIGLYKKVFEEFYYI